MNYEYKPAFDRTFKKLNAQRRKNVAKAVSYLIDFFEKGHKSSGLGLKQLRGDFWEIRVSIKDRILFTFRSNTVSFVIVGSHDDIRKFLKNI